MIAVNQLSRLHASIVAAGVAIDGVDANGNVSPASLQSAAQPTIDAFDQSVAAQNAWEDTNEPFLADLKAQADAAMATNATFLALATPNNAQLSAQVRALTQQNQRIIPGLRRTIQKIWRNGNGG